MLLKLIFHVDYTIFTFRVADVLGRVMSMVQSEGVGGVTKSALKNGTGQGLCIFRIRKLGKMDKEMFSGYKSRCFLI